MAGDAAVGIRLQGDASGAVKAMSLTRGQLGQLERGMQEAAKRTKALDSGFKQWAKSTLDVRGALAGLAASLAGGALLGGIGRVLANLEEINRTALALGTSTETVQEFGYSFRQVGLQTDDVADAFNTLADRAQDAVDGTTSMVDDFGLLGLSVDELRNKSPEELFRIFARAVGETHDPTRRAAGVVRTLGDDLGRKLLPLLIQGEAGFERFAAEARRLGIVLDDELIDGASGAAREFRKVKELFDAQLTKAVANQSDSFSSIAQTLNSAEFRQGLEFAVQSFDDIAKLITKSLNLTGQLANKLDEYSQKANQAARAFGQSLGIDPIEQVIGDFIGRQLGLEKSAATRLPAIHVTASALPTSDGRSAFSDSGERAKQAAEFRPMDDFLAALDEARYEKFLNIDEPIKKAADASKELAAVANQVGQSFGDAFSASVSGAESFGDALTGLGEQLALAITKAILLKAIQTGINSAFPGGGLAAGFATSAATAVLSAKGNAFDEQGVVPFARGGVVNRPTVFPFARGVGLMGEAGPEAILPLSRGRGGKLGVQASGGGVVVNINNHSQSQVTTNSRRGQDGQQVLDLLIEDSFNRLLGSGRLDASLAANTGMRRPGRF